jgi:hypothetical protein
VIYVELSPWLRDPTNDLANAVASDLAEASTGHAIPSEVRVAQ